MDTMQSLVGSVLRQRGYHVFKHAHLQQATLSLFLRNVFTSQQIDCVFDVGANRGQYRDFLREAVGYTGLIHSFEPAPHLIDALTQRHQETQDPHWFIHGCALGRAEAEAPFHVMQGDQLSSFRAPSTKATDRFHASNTVVKVVQVKVCTLDRLWPELYASRPFSRPYLKIDTQGYDLEVANGATASLPNVVALQSEASMLSLYEGAPLFEDTLAYFRGQGFAPAGFYPIGTDQNFRLIDCDCVFVNPSKIRAAAVERY